MKALIACTAILASTFCWADGSQATSSANSSQTKPQPLPSLDESSGLKNAESRFDNGASGLSEADVAKALNDSADTATVLHPPTDEDKEEEQKLEAEKNWLINGVRDRQTNEQSGTSLDKYTQLHNQALKSLSKVPDKAYLIKNGLGTSFLSPTDKNKPEDKSAETENKQTPVPLTPTLASTDGIKATPALGEIQKFTPSISGLSLDSLKPLDNAAEKTYADKVASIAPIATIDFSNFSNPSGKSFTPIEPISISTTSYDLPTLNSEITPMAPSSPGTLNVSPVAPVAAVAPLTPSPILPIESPHSSSLSTPSVYKSKVADPADFLNN